MQRPATASLWRGEPAMLNPTSLSSYQIDSLKAAKAEPWHNALVYGAGEHDIHYATALAF
jgi:hypothetical protein